VRFPDLGAEELEEDDREISEEELLPWEKKGVRWG
jgi:hypothetical protein